MNTTTEPAGITLHGACDRRFAAVREELDENFATRGEIGSAICIYLDGKPVVDLWGGFMDGARQVPWRADTLCVIYSLSKSLCALCVHILADRGLVDLEAPVATYWPEFAQNGKEAVKVRHILSHNCGVCFADAGKPDDIFDPAAMVRVLEMQAPAWPPETKGAYNTVNIGYLAGEIVRRVTGQRIQDFLQENVCKPLGVSLYLGVPESELGRCADLTLNPAGNFQALSGADPSSPVARAWKPMAADRNVNTARYRMAGVPSFGGFAEARALARIYAALGNGGSLDGVQLLSPEAIARATQTQWASEANAMTGLPLAMSMGFWKNMPGASPLGDSPNAFGHLGSGGARVFADPERGLAVGYVTNFQTEGTGTGARVDKVIDAVMRCMNQ